MDYKIIKSSILFTGALVFVLIALYITKSGKGAVDSSLLLYFPLVGQALLDIIAGILCLKLHSLSSDNAKYFFKYLGIAFFFGAVADLSYNVIINVFHVQLLTPLLVSIYDIPFALFLFFQALAWGVIFKKIILDKGNKSFLIYLPAIISALIIMTVFFYAETWHVRYTSVIGIYNILDTLLASVAFVFCVFCLATGRSRAIMLLAVGYLVVISSDFIIRYEVVRGLIPHFNPFEGTWILGLMLMLTGLYAMLTGKSYQESDTWNCQLDSVQTQIAFWGYTICMLSIFAFLLIKYSLIPDQGIAEVILLKNFPSLLILFSVFAILISNYFSRNISSPFFKLEGLIDRFLKSKGSYPHMQHDFKIREFNKLESVLIKGFDLLEQNEKNKQKLYESALSMAHDIKSPLTALEVVTKDLKSVPEEERIIIRDAVDRIYGIANNLLTKYRGKDNAKIKTGQVDNELVYFLLKNIICEKQTEFSEKSVAITFEPNDSIYDLSVSINKIEFKRIISNLINNAVEATDCADSQVNVSLTSKLGEAIITVTDNGSGISEQDLSRVIQGGFSKGKEHGSGLGIAHAIKHIKAWKGDYDITSTLGKGTTFTMSLPISESVSWFAKSLNLANVKTLIVADDDKSIHQVWRKRLGDRDDAIDIKLIDFYTLDELNTYIQQASMDNKLFLIDYEFIGDKSNGLEFINQHNLAKHAYLVTSRYEDERVRKRCQALGITLIPKSYAAYIPITVESPALDLILIDDNTSLTKSWELSATIVDKKIKTFNNIDALLQFVTSAIKDVPIYIDYDLNNQLTGIELSKQLYEQGFKQLYLATGHDKSYFTESIPWVVDIVSKKPPF